MHWPEALENHQAISSLFSSEDDLSFIELHEILAHRDGPTLRLRFDVAPIPKIFPRSWPSETNTVQVRLAAWGVVSLHIRGWGTSVAGQLSVADGKEGMVLRFSSEACVIEAKCAAIRIEGLSGYVNSHDA